MRCTSPRTVGFKSDGKTLAWSPKDHSREYAIFQLPCGKCIACRLEYSRQWAIRCVHEASMHEDNSFITLTYSDENLKSDKLIYEDFQLFMKRLREKNPERQIGFFVTGEYGEIRKRPHWHAIVFNYRPADCVPKYKNDRGDQVYSSKTLDELWSHGITELGSVNFDSAGYCARYAAKKLVHGSDQSHDFHPISKKSSRYAIGKKFLETYWRDIFNLGEVVLPDGQTASIPRYYEKWLKKNEPAAWNDYVTLNKTIRTRKAVEKISKEQSEEKLQNEQRLPFHPPRISRIEARRTILDNKFKQLQKFLKL